MKGKKRAERPNIIVGADGGRRLCDADLMREHESDETGIEDKAKRGGKK